MNENAIGSPAWFVRRAELWREDAVSIVVRLREYEECHPSVRDGVPCFFEALAAAEKAITVCDSAAPLSDDNAHTDGAT